MPEGVEVLEDQTYFSVEQLAARHKCTVHAVYQRRHRGEGPPAFKVGRRLLFPRVDVEAWERREQAAAASSAQ